MSKKDDEIAVQIVMYVIFGILLSPVLIMYYIVKLIVSINTLIENKNKNRVSYKLTLSTDDREQLAKIDNMDGKEFENFMTAILIKNGFGNVQTTKTSGDHGADILGKYNGVKYAFQCKRFESKVGSRPIGEILRGMNYYGCEKGVVITNNYFTKQAHIEAKVNKVELWDRDKIIQLCRNIINKKEFLFNNKPIK